MKIDTETEEAKNFLNNTFYEQLTIIKGLRSSISKEEEDDSYSIIDIICRK